MADFDYIVTSTDQEALHLEATLVKRHQPFFNVRLKDDKHYPYLKVDLNNPWPRVYITRRVENDGARYFGPYASACSVRTTLDIVKKLFPWRSCTKTITGRDPRPCLDYYIHRCIAPCTGYCTKEEYDEVIRQTILFLEGRTDEVVRDLRARRWTRRPTPSSSSAPPPARPDPGHRARLREAGDGLHPARGRGRLRPGPRRRRGLRPGVLHPRHEDDRRRPLHPGRHSGGARRRRSWPASSSSSTSRPPTCPGASSCPWPCPSSRSSRPGSPSGGAARCSCWSRSEARSAAWWRWQTTTPARRWRWSASSGWPTRARRGPPWRSSQEELDLPPLPRRIECYDISNIQGTSAVGSMVVFVDGRPRPAEYRRFRIKTVRGANDFAMLAGGAAPSLQARLGR